jgi:integrase
MRQRLGHTDVATTLSIYSHATDRMDEDAAEQIDRALG